MFRAGTAPNTLVGLVTGSYWAGTRSPLAARVLSSPIIRSRGRRLLGLMFSLSSVKRRIFCCLTDRTLGFPTTWIVRRRRRSATCTGLLAVQRDTASEYSSLPANVLDDVRERLTVPFVGASRDRHHGPGIYQNAVLFDPTSEPAPRLSRAAKSWNSVLLAQHGSAARRLVHQAARRA